MAKNFKSFLILIFSIVICQLVGFLGSLVTIPSISTWYQSIHKAPFNPPNWVFGPIWTLLFLLMGISLFLILNKKIKSKKIKKIAIFWFSLQLLLNFLWSFLFFGFHQPFLAFIDIIFLWIAIFFTIKKTYPVSKIASYLFYPYLLWVSFASILNLSIVILN
jgi:translocator protein